jgi:hypothetical protein
MKNRITYLISAVCMLFIVGSVAVLGQRNEHPSSAATAGATYTTEVAGPASSFLGSVGVNVHMDYSSYANGTMVATRLKQLGIRIARDNLGYGTASEISNLQKVQAQGIRLDLVHTLDKQRDDSVPRLMTLIKQYFLGSTDFVEGLNEQDGVQGTGSTWPQTTCQDQISFYNRFKADATLRHIPIFAPSLRGFDSNVTAPKLAGACNINAYIDYGNLHSYSGGYPAEQNIADRINIDRQYISKGKPLVATETGYHNCINTTATHLPTSIKATGIYTPQLYLEYYRQGLQRTFIYELLDQPESSPCHEQHFGLLYPDFSLKPSAQALQNLTAILNDTGAHAKSSLSFGFGAGDAANLRHVLLQKRDGSFYLALWRNTKVWDPVKRVDLAYSSPDLTVNFPTAMNITAYRPNQGVGAITSQASTSAFTTAVGPEVVLLRVTSAVGGGGTAGGGGTSAPTPTPTSSPKPDVVVEKISGFDSTHTYTNSQVKFTATVKNVGNAPTPAGTILGVGFYVDGKIATWSSGYKSSLTPGAAVTLTAEGGVAKVPYWTAGRGNHTIMAYADDINRFAELNENNNQLSVNLGVVNEPPFNPGTITGTKGGVIPGSTAPIVIKTSDGKTVAVAPNAKPKVSGHVVFTNPVTASKGAVTDIYIDGKKVGSSTGTMAPLDTTYLSNGKHAVTLVTKNPDGSTSYTSRQIEVHNMLDAYQALRNKYFSLVKNKVVANVLASTTILIVVATIVAAGVFAYFYWRRRGGSGKSSSPYWSDPDVQSQMHIG